MVKYRYFATNGKTIIEQDTETGTLRKLLNNSICGTAPKNRTTNYNRFVESAKSYMHSLAVEGGKIKKVIETPAPELKEI